MRRAAAGIEIARRLAFIGLAACIFGSTARAASSDAARLSCPDFRIPLDISIGGTPVASLTVGGQRGWFLIDSGASFSAIDAQAYGLDAGAAVEFRSPFCGSNSVFQAEDMGSFAAPTGGQRGRIGTDILAGLAITFSYGDPAPAMMVHAGSLDPPSPTAAGFVEIDRPGFYGGAASRRLSDSTDLPVIGLAIGPVAVPAQLDTGFDDAREPGLVQGNAPFLAELREKGDRACRPWGRRNAREVLSAPASRDQGRRRLRPDRRLLDSICANRRLVARQLANDDPRWNGREGVDPAVSGRSGPRRPPDQM